MYRPLSLFALFMLISAPLAPAALPVRPPLTHVPHVLQRPDFCGEACVEMAARAKGFAITQDQVFDAAGVDPAQGRGCYTAELRKAAMALGFRPGEVWYPLEPAKAKAQEAAQFEQMVKDLEEGVASIVCMHYDEGPETTEHFRLVVGFDATKEEVIYHEPAKADGASQRMTREKFLALWPLPTGEGRNSVIRLRMAGEAFKAPAASAGRDDAAYAQHVLALKKRLPAGFSLVVQRPFVVVGDETPEMVQRRATQTVAWAVEHLKKDYFSRDPEEILDIWLFKDKASYDKHTRAIFQDKPTTPYGYYSPADKALIMNIATGGGTLVHEIVHPFMRANFPECPAWFNEGMGSLYEQSDERNGHIVGLTNWRLAGLQEAIAAGRVPSFKTLAGTEDQAFYRQDPGTNYAQARYLLYYLQEKGLLVKYYREFTTNRKQDPTGYRSLQKVLGETDMEAFQKRWEKWVAGRRFPSED